MKRVASGCVLALWMTAAAAQSTAPGTAPGPASAPPATNQASTAPPAAASALVTVGSVDLPRYMGRWYEVARYPNRFQRQCIGETTATYALLPDGAVSVTNRCITRDGVDEVAGAARRVDGATDKLEVSFLPAALRWLPVGWGRYWVIDLAPDYRYAVVGEPSREYLWVLARTPQLAPADRAAIDARLRAQGYDPARLVTAGAGR